METEESGEMETEADLATEFLVILLEEIQIENDVLTEFLASVLNVEAEEAVRRAYEYRQSQSALGKSDDSSASAGSMLRTLVRRLRRPVQ